MSRPRRALGYARVSSEEQARGTSLQDQQEAIRAYAKARGVAVAKLYVEAESAVHEKIERREQIQALMADVREHDLVLCDKLDRWSRDPEFTYGSVRKILAAGASFYAISDRCDPSTSEGDTALGFRILFAREEHKRIRERMVGTRQLLRDKGYYVEGLPPYGYRRPIQQGHRSLERNIIEVIPPEAAIVRRIFRLAVGGRSIDAIAERVGLKRDRVKDVLHRRLYLGEIRNTRGEWVPGKHAAIIDAATYEAAQGALLRRRLGGARPRGGESETTEWVLRDVATCHHCGGRMSAAWADRGPKRRRYYRCSHSCTSRYVSVKLVDAEVEPMVLARLAELREALGKGAEPTPVAVVDFTALRAKLQRRRERYLEAYADESMTRPELREAMGRLDAERLKLDAQEQATKRPVLASREVRREMLRELAAHATAWSGCGPRRRRVIVTALAAQVRMSAQGKTIVVWRTLEELAVGET